MPSNAPPPPPKDTDVNQYIPTFISKKPFYVDNALSDSDYLEHQRLQALPQDTLATSKWYDRGRKAGPAATKYRKGACENCGAMTHKTKDCLSRPRKQGAKWTGKDIQADELVGDVKLGWDAKRDRWNGYDAREYTAVVQEYEELEKLKRAANGEATKEGGEEGDAGDVESARYAEETDMGRNQPTSTRNLRIREDTAKYLVNLDLESTKYDPKTRSMASGPPDPGGAITETLADEGFARPEAEGDAAEFEKAQRYAWETQERNGVSKKLHLQANPTEGEVLRRKGLEEAKRKKEEREKMLRERYGGDEYRENAGKKAAFRVQEGSGYVEYDEDGQIKGQKKLVSDKSKYAEDVLVNNHTEVWGSWWRDGRWGYGCCHSSTRNSYCTGDEGRIGFEEAEGLRYGQGLLLEDVKEQDDQDQDKDEKDEKAMTTAARPKKRTLKEMQDGVTEEEMEEFRRNRTSALDPMAKMLGKDGLRT